MLKVITLKFEDRLEGFDDSLLSEAISDKEIIAWKCELIERKNRPYWSIILEYNPLDDTEIHTMSKSKAKHDGYKSILSEGDWPVFEKLREWRKEKSKEEGVPPFILFSNFQLAKIAVTSPTSLNGLQAIKGIGEAKRKKYGKEVLSILHGDVDRPTQKGEEDEVDGRT